MFFMRSGKLLTLLMALLLVLCLAMSACGRSNNTSAERAAPVMPEIIHPTNEAENAKASAPSAADAKPSYDCSAKLSSSIEELICQDSALAALDQQMAEVFAAAAKTEKAAEDKYFKARQRGWIKGRNDCWKAQDKHQCVVANYKQGILELQVRYGLVPSTGSVTYLCDGAPLTATYYETDPPSAVARYKEQESILVVARSGSGSKYVGPNESIWEHQGEATIVWGFEATEMHCKVRS